MNHTDLVACVNTLSIISLDPVSFKDFVRGAEGVLLPRGTRISQYFRPGYCEAASNGFDWSKGQPPWEKYQEVFVMGMDCTPDHPKVTFYFEDALPGIFDALGKQKWRFAFDLKKLLYLRREDTVGTPEFPWEEMYVRE
jgi:hypothetical protein